MKNLEHWNSYAPQLLSKHCEYKKTLDNIRRVIHLDDYAESIKVNSLKTTNPNWECNKSQFCDKITEFQNIKVLWFATSTSADSHDYYGNVGFDINIEDIKNYFGKEFHMYYVEYVQYPQSYCVRILITRKQIPKTIQVFDLTKKRSNEGMPLQLVEGSLMYVTGDPDFAFQPSIDLLIDCEGDDEKWFFNNCTRFPVNHGSANAPDKANIYKSYKCRKFNNKMRKEERCLCPYPFDIERCKLEMAQLAEENISTSSQRIYCEDSYMITHSSRAVVYNQNNTESPPKRMKQRIWPDIIGPKKVSPNCIYKQLESLRRVVHLDDFEKYVSSQSLKSRQIELDDTSDFSKNITTLSNIKVLFFAPSKSQDVSDYYGNVGFEISIDDIKNHFGENFKLYYVELVTFRKSYCVRVLVTRKIINDERIFNLSDSRNYEGMPVRIKENSLEYAYEDYPEFDYPPDIDFMIDCEGDDEKWFFQNCDVVPVNHNSANSKFSDAIFMPRICRKYNNRVGRNMLCPTPFDNFKIQCEIYRIQKRFRDEKEEPTKEIASLSRQKKILNSFKRGLQVDGKIPIQGMVIEEAVNYISKDDGSKNKKMRLTLSLSFDEIGI